MKGPDHLSPSVTTKYTRHSKDLANQDWPEAGLSDQQKKVMLLSPVRTIIHEVSTELSLSQMERHTSLVSTFCLWPWCWFSTPARSKTHQPLSFPASTSSSLPCRRSKSAQNPGNRGSRQEKDYCMTNTIQTLGHFCFCESQSYEENRSGFLSQP